MLKRQRSTPSFVPDPPYAAPEPAIETYERAAKRRRQGAPSDGRSGAPEAPAWGVDDTDGEEDVEGEEQTTSRAASSLQAASLERAGEYRNVNTLLHDLHAEQRHRMLFSSSLPPSHLPMLHHHTHSDHYASHAMEKSTPHLSPDGAQESAHHDVHKHTSFTISIPSKDASVVDHVEVQNVTQRYEDTNRYVFHAGSRMMVFTHCILIDTLGLCSSAVGDMAIPESIHTELSALTDLLAFFFTASLAHPAPCDSVMTPCTYAPHRTSMSYHPSILLTPTFSRRRAMFSSAEPLRSTSTFCTSPYPSPRLHRCFVHVACDRIQLA
ncbi:hypothetical protein BD413DRAFT_126488 [Trametes elegans]|nr:hypothetical protein BD413DRAFT_126488 [Trametes elegans]